VLPKGSFYTALYHRITDGTITRIATQVPNSVLLYNIFQNAGRSNNTGLEVIWQHNPSKLMSYTVSANIYQNTIEAFSVTNKYPALITYTSAQQQRTSGNAKFNTLLHLKNGFETQISAVYLAPDIIPQGTIDSRFSLDFGVKKAIQKGKGELFLNATDVLNTMQISKEIMGSTFTLKSTDYFETQVVRVGYNLKF
jgi:outer membrane receptor protein involved in Fe transport